MTDSLGHPCATCGQPVPPGSRFCPACAAPISASRVASAEPETVVQGELTGPSPSGSGPATFPPGSIVDGKYEVRERLGAGGFGEVYRVHHTILKRDLALKTLLPMLVRDAKLRARFFREARVLMELSHPNVITIRDVGEWGDIVYLVMDFCPGETLHSILKKRGRLPGPTVAGMALPVLRALEYAHGKGVVHRDLKPANLMVTPATGTAVGVRGRSDIKVLDFGVAKVVSDEPGGGETGNLTGTGVAIGTIHYMSPEQASGESPSESGLDGRADLYSLGVVMFEAVTGRRPFDAPNNTQVYKKVLLDDPPTFESLAVPQELPGLEALIRRCMAKSAADRPANARAMAVEIEGLLRGRSASSASLTVGGTSAVARPRAPAIAAAGSLLFLLVLGILAVSLGWLSRPPAATNGSANAPANAANTPEVEPGNQPPANVPDLPVNQPANVAANVPDPIPANGTVEPVPPANDPGELAPRPYPAPSWRPTLDDPALPPALAAEWGVLGTAYNQALEQLLVDRERARQTLQDVSRASERGVAAHAQAALAVLEVRDRDLARAEEAARRMEQEHPEAPVLAGVRGLLNELREQHAHEEWEVVRRRSEESKPPGKLPPVPHPFAEARRIAEDWIRDHPESLALESARAWLEDLDRQEEKAVAEGYAASMRVARERARGDELSRALDCLRAALGFRPESEEAQSLRSELEAKLALLREVATLEHPEAVLALTFGADGKSLITACGDKLGRVWDIESGKAGATLRGHTGPVHDVVLVAKGKKLATAGGDGTIRLWELPAGREWRKLSGHKGAVQALATDRDGATLYSGGADGTVRQWNVEKAKAERSQPVLSDPVEDLALSPNGDAVVSVARDGMVRIWVVDGRAPVRSLPDMPVHQTCVAFGAADHQLLTGGGDGCVRIWSLPGAVPRSPMPAHEGALWAIARSPDKELVATAGDDGMVLLWEPGNWRLLATYRGHTGAVRTLAFSPDGKRLASGGEDKTARVWNVVR